MDNKTIKGNFPHEFTTNTNQQFQDTTSLYPDHFEIPDKHKATVEKWYKEQCGVEWNHAKELTAYCISDVEVLKAGCEEEEQ